MIITCPECSSKFKVDDSILEKQGVKMRCSVCTNVFSPFDKPENKTGAGSDTAIEQEPSSRLSDIPEESSPVDTGLTYIEDASPEIKVQVTATADRTAGLKNMLKGLLVILIIAIALILSYNKGAINIFNKKSAGQLPPEQLYPFLINDSDATFKTLMTESGEQVFLIKGIAKKNIKKPLKSLLIEVSIFDGDKNPIGVKTVYAGNLPPDSEFVSKKEKEIDSALMDGTRPLGVLSEVDEIPYCAAFYGPRAINAASIKAEVKEFVWQ